MEPLLAQQRARDPGRVQGKEEHPFQGLARIGDQAEVVIGAVEKRHAAPERLPQEKARAEQRADRGRALLERRQAQVPAAPA